MSSVKKFITSFIITVVLGYLIYSLVVGYNMGTHTGEDGKYYFKICRGVLLNENNCIGFITKTDCCGLVPLKAITKP